MIGAMGFGGAATAPHHAATQAARDVLAEGGNAIEAMVAAAAMISVVYPHMTGLGGDGFWLIHRPGNAPLAISACGPAAGLATRDFYAEQGYESAPPARGALAALTVPGAIAGWDAALGVLPERMPLSRLLAPAVAQARSGIAVPASQAALTAAKFDELSSVPGFAPIYMPGGQPPATGDRMVLGALADTLQRLSDAGLRDFYDGDLAATHDRFLTAQGSPLRGSDLAGHTARQVTPLSVRLRAGTVFNHPPPTQGPASLAILGIFDRIAPDQAESVAHVHALVEATKQAFLLRNAELGDPRAMPRDAAEWLTDTALDRMARAVDMTRAAPWPQPPADGGTIWMGTADTAGNVVSYIQSVYWEFGSGLTCPETGIVFQNRGHAFSLLGGPNALVPGHYPFHTLNPALAHLSDGRVLAYGTMGGEGQPQTQSALFTRHVHYGQSLARAIAAPRWLLGRTWGDASTTLKLESRFDPALIETLSDMGHLTEVVSDYDDVMGHAGAVALHPSGLMEAAGDPRADAAALCL